MTPAARNWSRWLMWHFEQPDDHPLRVQWFKSFLRELRDIPPFPLDPPTDDIPRNTPDLP